MRETVQEFRQLQQQALQEAGQTEDPVARRGLLAFADLWGRMAIDAEKADSFAACADRPAAEG